MRVTDLFEGRPGETQAAVLSETREEIHVLLNSEHSLELYAEDRLLHRFLCTPSQLGALCAGWLLSEGYGGEAVEIAPDGRRATVEGALSAALPPRPLTLAAAADPKEMLALFHAGSDAHARTHGIHECVIRGDGWSLCRTDIGRHNAIDKALGAAILAGYALEGATLFTSGRINVQTVEKAARCGIGCLMTKAVVTAQALARARALQLPLFFSVKEDHFLEGANLPCHN